MLYLALGGPTTTIDSNELNRAVTGALARSLAIMRGRCCKT